MNVILFDSNRSNFYPLSYTRPISEFRIGILTIKEKWTHYYKNISTKTEDYLVSKYPIRKQKENLWIDASVLPSKELKTELDSLRNGEVLESNGKIIAFKNLNYSFKNLNKINTSILVNSIENIWDIFSDNGREIEADFKLLTKARKSQKISDTNTVIGKHIFIEKGAKISCSILNAENGPIYIGKNTEIMEGAIIRGPFAMGENAVLKMGAKIYGPTTLGPHCKVGGEVNNSVFFGYSSKAHDGFLGNSVIGEWCNLGADTNNSNLKNNYAEVKLWNYEMERFKKTGLQFCGLIMGDHSKCGINTMFNTGTVIGVSANIFGSGFPRNFIPSFSWGGASGFQVYKLPKVFEVASKVFERRKLDFDENEQNILSEVYDMTKRYRNE
ncbi:MAG: glucose-1-phosphate thymidylyltransferase [Flavobacteriales bacterium]|nr:glucose-1-phosphate thymidylyltransferase [Flavobacteriales bacterium]